MLHIYVRIRYNLRKTVFECTVIDETPKHSRSRFENNSRRTWGIVVLSHTDSAVIDAFISWLIDDVVNLLLFCIAQRWYDKNGSCVSHYVKNNIWEKKRTERNTKKRMCDTQTQSGIFFHYIYGNIITAPQHETVLIRVQNTSKPYTNRIQMSLELHTNFETRYTYTSTFMNHDRDQHNRIFCSAKRKS